MSLNGAAHHRFDKLWHTHRTSRPRDAGSAVAAYKQAQSDLWNAAGAAVEQEHTELLRPLFDHIVSRVDQNVGRSSAVAILDIATGPGEPSLSVAKALPACSVVATDLAAGMIAKARGRAQTEGLNNFRCA